MRAAWGEMSKCFNAHVRWSDLAWHWSGSTRRGGDMKVPHPEKIFWPQKENWSTANGNMKLCLENRRSHLRKWTSWVRDRVIRVLLIYELGTMEFHMMEFDVNKDGGPCRRGSLHLRRDTTNLVSWVKVQGSSRTQGLALCLANAVTSLHIGRSPRWISPIEKCQLCGRFLDIGQHHWVISSQNRVCQYHIEALKKKNTSPSVCQSSWILILVCPWLDFVAVSWLWNMVPIQSPQHNACWVNCKLQSRGAAHFSKLQYPCSDQLCTSSIHLHPCFHTLPWAVTTSSLQALGV